MQNSKALLLLSVLTVAVVLILKHLLDDDDSDDVCGDTTKRIDLETGTWTCARQSRSLVRAISSRLSFATCQNVKNDCAYSEKGLSTEDVNRMKNIPCGNFSSGDTHVETHKDQLRIPNAILAFDDPTQLVDHESIRQCVDADKKINLSSPNCNLYAPRLKDGKLLGYFKNDGTSLLVKLIDAVWTGCDNITDEGSFMQRICNTRKVMNLSFEPNGSIIVDIPMSLLEDATNTPDANDANPCRTTFTLTRDTAPYITFMLYLAIYFKYFANNKQGVSKEEFKDILGGLNAQGEHKPISYLNVQQARPPVLEMEGNCSNSQNDRFNMYKESQGEKLCMNKNPWDTTACCEKPTSCSSKNANECSKDERCKPRVSCVVSPDCRSTAEEECNNKEFCEKNFNYICNTPRCFSYKSQSECENQGCNWDSKDGGSCEYLERGPAVVSWSPDPADCPYGVNEQRYSHCMVSKTDKRICSINTTSEECDQQPTCRNACREKSCAALTESECKEVTSRCRNILNTNDCESDNDCEFTCEEYERLQYGPLRTADPKPSDCKYGWVNWCQRANERPLHLCDSKDCGTGYCEPSYAQYEAAPNLGSVSNNECMNEHYGTF